MNKRLIQLTIEAPSAVDAFDALFALTRSQLAADEMARELALRAKERVEQNELKIPSHVGAHEFLEWVAFNLESEEGLLDEDTPPYLKKAVGAAVSLLNDPLAPMPCVQAAPSTFVLFDRA